MSALLHSETFSRIRATGSSKLLVLMAAALIGLSAGGCLAETGDDDFVDEDENIGQLEEPFTQGGNRRVKRVDHHRQDDDELAGEATSNSEPDPEPWHGEIDNDPPPPPSGGDNNEENDVP